MTTKRAWAAILLVAAGCSDDGAPNVAGWEDVSDVELPCDVAAAPCRSAIFQRVALLRSQPEAELPPIRIITRADYVSELEAGLDTSPESPRTTRFSNALGLLGLLERSQSLAVADSAASAERVLAYYNHASDDITLIAENATDEEDGSYTLAHELTHALQDQRENLTEVDRKYITSTDSMVAVDALVEGEAMWTSIRFLSSIRDRTPKRTNTDTYFGGWIDSTLSDIADSGSPWVVAQQLLPYGFGGLRVSHVWFDDGGTRAVASLYRTAGVTFARWVEASSVQKPQDLACTPPTASAGGQSREVYDSFGMPGLIALYAGLGHSAEELLDLANGWRGDWLATYAPKAADSTDTAIGWRIALASSGQAMELAAEVEDKLGLHTEVSGQELLIVGGTTDELQAELANTLACTPATRVAQSAVPGSPNPVQALARSPRHVLFRRN
jgi:hypothetical protein